MAQQGLSDASMMQARQSNDRALDNGIDALLRAGGGINSISDLYSRYGENSTQLAIPPNRHDSEISNCSWAKTAN